MSYLLFVPLTWAVVLQDLPAVVAEAKLPDDIEAMAYDFFTPHPVKGKQSQALRLCAVLLVWI